MKKLFTKKHHEFLARFLAYELSVSDGYSIERQATIKGIARLLGSTLQNDNSKFDYKRFLKAANVPE
jgi:hypothetical protein